MRTTLQHRMALARARLEPVWRNIDREIRDLVLALNAEGFETEWSCSGHRDRPERKLDGAYVALKAQSGLDAWRLAMVAESLNHRLLKGRASVAVHVAHSPAWCADPGTPLAAVPLELRIKEADGGSPGALNLMLIAKNLHDVLHVDVGEHLRVNRQVRRQMRAEGRVQAPTLASEHDPELRAPNPGVTA